MEVHHNEARRGRIWTPFVLIISMLLISSGVAAAPPQGYQLAWSDEFTGINSQPSSGTWNYDLGGGGWGNGEWQTYVNSWANAHVVGDSGAVDGQALQIRAEQDGAGNYYSARINSAGKQTFRYGYMEMRAKLPWSQGYWPAFWMLGQNIGTAGWPACGEIDIMEYIGSQQGIAHGSLHLQGHSGGNALTQSYYLPNGWSFAQGYHTFGVLWLPDFIQFSVDGQVYQTRTPNDTGGTWPFNDYFFFVLNLAVGGGFAGNPNGSTVAPMNYLVDYVRVYKPNPIPYGSFISLQSHANGMFVCAENGGQEALIANRTSVAGWEKFQVVDAGDGMVALRSQANQKFVTAENGGGSALIANRDSIGTWEKFEWVDFGGSNIALKSNANWKYVTAENGGGSPLIANRNAPGGWETFTVGFHATGAAVGEDDEFEEDRLTSNEQPVIAAPNPADSFASVVFNLNRAAQAKLVLYDLSGAVVSSIDLGRLPAGESRARYDLEGVAPGVYLLMLQSDEGLGYAARGTFKLAVVK